MSAAKAWLVALVTAAAAGVVALSACSDSSPTDAPVEDPPVGAAEAIYPTFGALHEQAVTRTCALNNGVCHDSKMYPDLRSTSGFLKSTVNQPCNSQVDNRKEFKDACEPVGDHLVLAALGIDAEIATVDVGSADAGPVASVTVTLATSVGTPKLVPGSAVEVHRGGAVFRFPKMEVTSASDKTVVLDFTKIETYPQNVRALAQEFFDDRQYPWGPQMVRVADVNRNGTLGSGRGIRLVVPGDPMKSFVVLRLIDENEGELMPLACRQWTDAATRALGCWIKGLKVDANGVATNADDPIDYATCDFDPVGKGRCSNVSSTGYAGVQAIFGRACGGSGCHVGEKTPAGGLDLSPGKSRAALVGVRSGQANQLLVKPGSPDSSYLMCKLQPSCGSRLSERMPKGGLELAPAELDVLRNWIAAGATEQ